MSGTDTIVINTRERASSGDINDLQALKDRSLLDSLREQFQARSYALGVQPTEVSQPVVMGGLEAGPSGTDIAIQAGVLLQDSATLLPIPGSLDSNYRWASLRASSLIANPLPGSDTYYLIEAQMSEVVASTATRDIFNTGTGLFVPTLVDKRTERTIIFQLVAGDSTNFPLPSGGDWVVIGGVLVPTGGAAIPVANFVDMRPLVDDLEAVRPVAELGRRASHISTPTDPDLLKSLVIHAEAWTQGRRLWFETDENGVGINAALATFREPGTNPQIGDTLSYLYLAPVQDAATRALFARNAYTEGGIANINANGLLVWSTNAPGADGEANGSVLPLPAPFANYTVPIGGAPCIGAVHTTPSAVIAACGMDGQNFQTVQVTNAAIAGWSDSFVPTGGGTADAVALADVPVGARNMRIMIQWSRNAAGSQGATCSVQPTSGTALKSWYLLRGDWDTTGMVTIDIPAATAFELAFSGTAPSSVEVFLLGFSL